MSWDPIPIDEQVIGTEVVVFTIGGAGARPNVRISTIEKVNAKTFRVADEPYLFPRGSCERRGSGRWSDSRHVTLRSSPSAQTQVHEMRIRAADNRVINAFDDWKKSGMRTSMISPYDALVKLRDAVALALQHGPQYQVDTEKKES